MLLSEGGLVFSGIRLMTMVSHLDKKWRTNSDYHTDLIHMHHTLCIYKKFEVEYRTFLSLLVIVNGYINDPSQRTGRFLREIVSDSKI